MLNMKYQYSVSTAPNVSCSSHLSAGVSAESGHDVKQMINELEDQFDVLKNNIRECLERQRIAVRRVADVLTSLSPDEDEYHRVFMESHVRVLVMALNHSELFGTMNLHWNYLDPSLLEHLVRKVNLREVKLQMKHYKEKLQLFRMNTPLTLFCRAQKRKRIRLTPDFQEIVVDFNWKEDVTLEAVEQFRREYASHYKLHEFAMMMAQARPGSFIITWFIPESIVDKLKANIPRAILEKYLVSKLKIAGVCVYPSRKPKRVSGD